MNGNERDTGMLVLDSEYSTTRRVVDSAHNEGALNPSAIKSLFLPVQADRIGEGGLRTRGYYKRSVIEKPLITVITVVRNAEERIEKAILSVLEQSYDNVEYIVVDGASTDATLEIIKKYEKAIDYWVSEEDDGVYDAMNKGVRVASGDYVLFLGSDDVLFDVFHEIADLLAEKTVSYYGSVTLSNNKKVYDGRFNAFKLFLKNIPHQAILYSRLMFYEYAFDVKYIAVADYALNLKLYSDERYGFAYIPFNIAVFDNENGLSSTIVDKVFSSDKPAIIKKHYSSLYYMIYLLVRSVFRKKIKFS
jgi:glycosyltransferase involved in cell wall biosynthesis